MPYSSVEQTAAVHNSSSSSSSSSRTVITAASRQVAAVSAPHMSTAWHGATPNTCRACGCSWHLHVHSFLHLLCVAFRRYTASCPYIPGVHCLASRAWELSVQAMYFDFSMWIAAMTAHTAGYLSNNVLVVSSVGRAMQLACHRPAGKLFSILAWTFLSMPH
jgi:hypothetical protein